MTTKKDMYAAIITAAIENPAAFTLADPADVVEFCNAQIASIEKRAAAPRTPTARQVYNEKLKKAIIDILSVADAPLSISDMLATGKLIDENGAPCKMQKINSLLIQLKGKNDDGPVQRCEGKVAYFILR